MRLILLGPPGAGKGTQSKKIIDRYHIPQISSGDIFRANIKEKTPLGKKISKYLEKGLLVPDEIVIATIMRRLTQEDCKNGFLLDGFPRTVAQADALEQELERKKLSLNKVILLRVDFEELKTRIVGRRICPRCGASFHVRFNPSQNDTKCDRCHELLVQREDDKEETVEKRIQIYIEQTKPLVQYYESRNELGIVDGLQSIEDVFESIVDILER